MAEKGVFAVCVTHPERFTVRVQYPLIHHAPPSKLGALAFLVLCRYRSSDSLEGNRLLERATMGGRFSELNPPGFVAPSRGRKSTPMSFRRVWTLRYRTFCVLTLLRNRRGPRPTPPLPPRSIPGSGIRGEVSEVAVQRTFQHPGEFQVAMVNVGGDGQNSSFMHLRAYLNFGRVTGHRYGVVGQRNDRVNVDE